MSEPDNDLYVAVTVPAVNAGNVTESVCADEPGNPSDLVCSADSAG